ncbi:hypothetical protein NGB74_02695 [Staphylococcus chromogenes]|uniref:hypothetical protein n=1 Tax=Staphylococcus chromogenes TaxID=46126 RepID=UPI002DBFC92F|nr:hypothetical protein [Staphylococcus chromogenes]MEB7449919.1 hypothetical protein [Staphylococcus chromogenes]
MKVESIFNGILVTPENSEEKQIVREHKEEIQKELSMYFEFLIKKCGGDNDEINSK